MLYAMRAIVMVLLAGCGGVPFTEGAAVEGVVVADSGIQAAESAVGVPVEDAAIDVGPEVARVVAVQHEASAEAAPDSGPHEADVAWLDAVAEPPTTLELCMAGCNSGCCTPAGVCWSGDTSDACGTGGALCAPCYGSQTCMPGGVCH
jgi:hypothetical protein